MAQYLKNKIVALVLIAVSGCATTYAPDLIGNGYYSQTDSSTFGGHTSGSTNLYYKPEKSWKKTWLTKNSIGGGGSTKLELDGWKLFGPNLVYVEKLPYPNKINERLMLYSPKSGFHLLYEKDYLHFAEVHVSDTGIICYSYGPDKFKIDREHPLEFKAEYLSGL